MTIPGTNPGINPGTISPDALRPRRRWYWVGGGLIAIGCLAGVAGFVFGLMRALGLPDFAATFSAGDKPATFQAAKVNGDGKTWLLYSDRVLEGSDAESDCAIEGADPAAAVTFPPYTHNSWGGGEEWHLVAGLDINEKGGYAISCHGPRTVDYAVGYGDSGLGIFKGIALTLAVTFLLPLAGIISGAIVLIVTGVRRGRHRTRLLRARAMPPGGYMMP